MRHIKHLNVEVTQNCNQACYYCFNNSKYFDKIDTQPAEFWLSKFKKLQKNGLKSVHLTGGEPFLYSNIIELLEGCYKLGLSTSVLSNGYKVKSYSHNYSDILSNIKVAQISLDSSDKEIHNQRRGYSKAWEDAIDAINMFKKLKVPTQISCTVDGNNINEISKLSEFAYNKDIKLIIRPMINKGRAKNLKFNNIESDVKKQIKQLPDKYKKCIVKDKFEYYGVETSLINQNKINSFTVNQKYIDEITDCGIC